MAELTSQLADTTSTWSREVAPLVEWFAQTLSSTASEDGRVRAPGTRLTQRRRYEGAGASVPPQKTAVKQNGVCSGCGAAISTGGQFCHTCSLTEAGKRLSIAQRLSKDAARTPDALTKRSQNMKHHRDSIRNWQAFYLPDWLDDNFYATKIQPVLNRLSKTAIATALGITKDYAYEIARGEKIPHRRHWVKLAELVGVTSRG